jgi:uncharacterized protein (TIGR03067 family)
MRRKAAAQGGNPLNPPSWSGAMRRIVRLLAGVLLVLPSLASDSPRGYDDGVMEEDSIEGTWQWTDDELDGRKVESNLQEVLTFRSGTYSSNYSDGDTFRGSYRLEPTRKPPHLDEVPSNGPYRGQTVKYIYQRDRDTLRIAFMAAEDDRRRPQGFNDKGVYVETYKRVKK